MTDPDALQTTLDERALPELHTSLHLARKAQAGDRDALNGLLARYQDRLRRIVRIRLGGKLRRHVESMDIVQETFGIAFKKLDDFELQSHAGILQWLAKIAEHKIHDAHDYHFAKKRDRDRDKPLAPPSPASQTAAGPQIPADVTAPDERAYKNEIREIMDEAMAHLPPDYREVILLRDYSGGEWDYVAGALDRKSKHACQELHRRAWIRLRRLVREKLEESG